MEMRTAYTTEIDEAEDALRELIGQLEPETLKAHTAGIISCHPEFVESGVAQYVADHLPFDVVGTTTVYGSASGKGDAFLLQVAALTSDDVRFAAAVSPSLEEAGAEGAAKAMAEAARCALGEEPKLAFVFLPLVQNATGDAQLEAIDAALGGDIPVFGTVTSGVEIDLSDGCVLARGLCSKNRAAALFFAGDVHPRFYLYSIANKNVRPNKALVTDADGYVVRKINGVTYFEYLRSIGIDVEREGVDFTNFPNMVDYDGRTVALGVYHVFEDGSILSAGKMPVGTTLTIGVVDQDSVFSTDYSALAAIKADEKPDCLFVVPCITRYFMLAPDSAAEARKIDDAFDMPYTLFYSGGEICPLRDEGGKLYNQFHNYSLTALAL